MSQHNLQKQQNPPSTSAQSTPKPQAKQNIQNLQKPKPPPRKFVQAKNAQMDAFIAEDLKKVWDEERKEDDLQNENDDENSGLSSENDLSETSNNGMKSVALPKEITKTNSDEEDEKPQEVLPQNLVRPIRQTNNPPKIHFSVNSASNSSSSVSLTNSNLAN